MALTSVGAAAFLAPGGLLLGANDRASGNASAGVEVETDSYRMRSGFTRAVSGVLGTGYEDIYVHRHASHVCQIRQSWFKGIKTSVCAEKAGTKLRSTGMKSESVKSRVFPSLHELAHEGTNDDASDSRDNGPEG